MTRSENLHKLQLYDSSLDSARKRIADIDAILKDSQEVDRAKSLYQELLAAAQDKNHFLSAAEQQVADQAFKIQQNEKKLYGGAVTNPKELEDLQRESESLKKYLAVLEERQLEAMLAAEEAQSKADQAGLKLEALKESAASDHQVLQEEKTQLQEKSASISSEKDNFLQKHDLPDLPIYQELRQSLGGIAVALLVDSSCSACGSSIPSAIAQEARSPSKLTFCPTCRRILHAD